MLYHREITECLPVNAPAPTALDSQLDDWSHAHKIDGRVSVSVAAVSAVVHASVDV